MSDNITDTERRFEIYVPKPKARINFGARNRTDTGPFGYDGLSIQSDVNLFIDGNKNTLYQTGQSFCGQVGGQWRQFSNDPMFLSATSNVTLAADNRVIIASGAGQGQITALDHGQKMHLVPYNELKLHYVIDALQTGLFEFFNGRHTRTKKSFGIVRSVDLEHFLSQQDELTPPSELLNKDQAPHKGGFLDMVSRSWLLLEGGAKESTLGAPTPSAVPWLSPLLGAEIAKAGDSVLGDLKYGYSAYLKRFDPYLIKKGGWLNLLHRAVIALKRYFHVALKYGQIVTDLPLIRNAIKGMEAVGGIMTAAFQAYHAGTDSYPALMLFERQQDGSFAMGSGGIADELTSGAQARVTGVKDSLDDARKAKVESAAPPTPAGWPLAADTTYKMSVSWGDGSKNDAIKISRSGPTPARMTLTLRPLTSTPETSTLTVVVARFPSAPPQTYTVPLDSTNTANATTLANAISAVIPSSEAEVTVESNVVVVRGSTRAVAVSLVWLETTADNLALEDRVGASAGVPALELRLRPPQLSPSGQKERLTLTVDGTTITFDLDPTRDLATTLRALPNLDLLAVIAGTGNAVTLTSRSYGAQSRIEAKVRTQARWTIGPSADERGIEACAAIITASEIVGLLGSLDGASASEADGKLAVEATAVGVGSTITVSGTLADLVFGSEPKTNTISGDPAADEVAGFSDADTGFKTLVSWNHELQKLPEDTRNLTRPLTEALEDTLAAFTAIESANRAFTEIFEQGPPPPPEAIGLLSSGGITLGTQDRIVGSGGKGIVFISDGGTGSPDRSKFVATEGFVADMGTWSQDFFKPRKETKKEAKRSLGFRVLSDSVVDMAATTYAQVAALGRAKAAEPRADDRQDVGIGIARVIGSYAAEVAGYEKVVISARNTGKDGDATGATGGRVELLGQRVVIGGVREKHNLANGTAQSLTDFANMGTESFALSALDGAEHLADGADSDKLWAKYPLEGAAWSPILRNTHPPTTHVDVHATTQVEHVVLPFRVQLTKEKAKIGIVAPVEDRRQALNDEKDRLRKIQDDLQEWVTTCTTNLATAKAEVVRLEVERDSIVQVLSSPYYDTILQRAKVDAQTCKDELERATDALNEATQAVAKATTDIADFTNDWESKAFPLMEITEDKITFGFVAGDGTWKDFAYMEMTKDGIKMFQPKANGVPTFDLAKKSGQVSDGTANTFVQAKDGKLTLKFANSAKSGPLELDAQGNVKIG